MKTQYILKEGMKEEIKKIKSNRQIATNLGITEGYVSGIMNRKKTHISKLVAYAFCKTISPDLEIQDLFEII